MPRLGSISGRSLANASTIRTFVAYPFVSANISGSASTSQLGGGNRIEVASAWTLTATTVRFVGTGLPYHSYYNNTAANIPGIQNYNISWTYRGGKNVEGNGSPTTGGLIGLWLNGVAMYDPSAQFGAPAGYVKLPEFEFNAAFAAGVELNYTFGEDAAGGHASPPNRYHYHDGSFFDAWLTGIGHVSGSYGVTGLAETSVIKYLFSGLYHSDGHSKILGISADGYPVYGPYGYANPSISSSGARRMVSGYTLNSPDSRIGTSAENITQYPMGIFIEDYSYTASGDMDQHNGRYCVTPDYPNGTYAYFTTLNSSLTPAYPYVIGSTFYGLPAIL
jgi:hypothetical protein